MKKIIPLVLGLFIGLSLLLTLGFLFWKSRTKPVIYETVNAEYSDIVQKTVATGALVPRDEVEIKPRVSGVIESLDVDPGDLVMAGDLIAVIRIIPDLQSLASAESRVQMSKISNDKAKNDRARAEDLYNNHAISKMEFDRIIAEAALSDQEMQAARRTLRIVRDGQAGGRTVSTHVKSTVNGMILDIPVKKGESVTETNTFNAGSTIATVADMSDMIFEGKVDESEVGKIREGLALEITVGALENEVFEGTLEYISPKGVLEDGAVQFEIEAAVSLKEKLFVRAGSSANAAIVLDRRKNVLSINESVLRFDGDDPYVEVEVSPQTFERQDVKLGLSDGITTEVLSGIDENTAVKAGEKE